MKILTKVVVGSRLHGLHNENSDYDYRGIHIHPLIDVLSPFKQTKNTDWIEGDEDNTSFELADFCKSATRGNATILEVFFSDYIVETSPIADELRANYRKFFDTDAFVMASRGYAHNQYNKMQLFEPDARTPKFAIAYLRVLWQCAEMLENGTFPCRIDDPDLKQFMLRLKSTHPESFTPLIPELTERFMAMQQRVTDAYAKAEKIKPEIKWIEEFIYRAYTSP
jgi:predicted nucleotidyltransferase